MVAYKRNNKKKVYRKKKTSTTPNQRYQNQKKKASSTYKKSKNNFSQLRRPFVEVKSQTHTEVWTRLGGTNEFPVADSVLDPKALRSMVAPLPGGPGPHPPEPALISQDLPLWSFLNINRGIDSKTMTGNSITGKYLTCKLHFEFPPLTQVNNPRYYIIHGWMINPLDLTEYTTPKKSEFTRVEYQQYIYDQIKLNFDEQIKAEFLQFNPKRTKNYITEGYQRIKADKNSLQFNPQIVYNSTANNNVLHGKPSPVNLTLKFNVENKKYTYSEGNSLLQGGPKFNFLNSSWLPFVLYYCPDAGQVPGGTDNSPAIAYDNKFYFTDS